MRKPESPAERCRKPRNVNACARGISLTRAWRVTASASESEVRKNATYTDTHDTRGVTVHVRGVTPCMHLPDLRSGPRAHNRHGGAICAAHAPLCNAYAILGTILARVCKGRCSVASSKAAVNETREVTFRIACGSGMSLGCFIDTFAPKLIKVSSLYLFSFFTL